MNWHDYFTYLPENGALIHKRRPETDRHSKTFNTKFADTYAGYLSSTMVKGKYRYDSVMVNVGGKMRGASRIVWEMHNGPIPKGMAIDHINRVTWDNRLENLRLATMAQNGANRACNKNSSTGLKGVSQDKRDGAWCAEITVRGKKISLGRHKTKGLAAVAYAKAALRYHGEFARITATR